MGTFFTGLTTEDHIISLSQYLVEVATKGHHSQLNQFRLLALQILKHFLFDSLYDATLNSANGFLPYKSYKNLDDSYEQQKQSLLQ